MEIRFKQFKTTQLHQSFPQTENKPSSLEFVHIDNPTQAKDKTTQRKVRRHVMKDIGRTRRLGVVRTGLKAKPKSTRVEIPSYWGDVQVCVNFRRLFWAMDTVSEGLLSITVVDPASKFRQKLASNLGSSQSLCEIEQYTESLRLVRKAITPKSQTSQNAVIGTVICLAVFDLRVGKSESWMMHMAGLEKIVELAGGVQVLDSRPAIRQSLFIADLLGSLIEDAKPRFPLPLSIPSLPSVKRSRCTQRLLTSFRDSESWHKAGSFIIDGALQSASQLAALLADVSTNDPLMLDLMIPVCIMAHHVLSLPRIDPPTKMGDSRNTNPVSAIAELVRLTVLSLFAMVITQTSIETIYVESRRRAPIRHLLAQIDDRFWTGRQELKLWMLVIHSCIETGPSRCWFVGDIICVMSLLRLKSWADLMSCLRRVGWIERVALSEMAQLKSDIAGSLSELGLLTK